MTEELVEKVRDKLSKVADPDTGSFNILDMGIVEDIKVNEKEKTAKIVIRFTDPGCTSPANIAMDAKMVTESLEEIDKAEIVVKGHMMADAIMKMVNNNME